METSHYLVPACNLTSKKLGQNNKGHENVSAVHLTSFLMNCLLCFARFNLSGIVQYISLKLLLRLK